MKLKTKWLLIIGIIIGLPLTTLIICTLSILGLGISNDKQTWVEPTQQRIDASHLHPVPVEQVVNLSSDTTLAKAQISHALQTARDQGLKIAISGARHSMGGHTAYPAGIIIDMLAFNKMRLESSSDKDGAKVILHVQSGARWSDIIPFLDARGYAIKIMQSNNPFTVGGTLSVNAHGWQHNHPPFGSSVEGFRLATADGKIINCNRETNSELFRCVIGGYGLFGIVLEVDLRVQPNCLYRAERFKFPAREYSRQYRTLVNGDTALGLVYGRLSIAPSSFLKEALLTRYREQFGLVPLLSEVKRDPIWMEKLKHLIFLASIGNSFGKEFRWFLESVVGGESAAEATRNQILNDPIDLFENHDSARTQILHEYFVPRDSLEAFLIQIRKIIPAYKGDLLNLTLRSLTADQDAFLSYAREDVFSLVLLFSQSITLESEKTMSAMTRELIDAASAVRGCYYLPYRPHATRNQFAQSYRMSKEFFALKREYDPEEIFQNQFYRNYGSTQP
jgi:FAD/FMN-containing dehydrogenase